MIDIHNIVTAFNEYLDAEEKFGQIELNLDTEQDVIDLIYRIKHLWITM